MQYASTVESHAFALYCSTEEIRQYLAQCGHSLQEQSDGGK